MKGTCCTICSSTVLISLVHQLFVHPPAGHIPLLKLTARAWSDGRTPLKCGSRPSARGFPTGCPPQYFVKLRDTISPSWLPSTPARSTLFTASTLENMTRAITHSVGRPSEPLNVRSPSASTVRLTKRKEDRSEQRVTTAQSAQCVEGRAHSGMTGGMQK